MTPGGFVYLSADQVEMISRGDITEIIPIQDSAGLICQWIYPNCQVMNLFAVATMRKSDVN